MQSTLPTLTEGTHLQQYRVGKVLGRGGFGITYQGQDLRTGQMVAIKELFLDMPPKYQCARTSDNTTVIPKFDSHFFDTQCANIYKEYQSILIFKGKKGIVQALDCFRANNTIYLVMELVEGKSVTNIVELQSRLSEQQAAYYVIQVLKALDEVHQKGLLHRDIKPDNVLVTPQNEVVLIDFGVMTELQNEAFKEFTVIRSGTYSAPELQSSIATRLAYTDIYSVGALLYYMVMGQRPPSREDIQKTGWGFDAAISQRMAQIIAKAMQPRREDRFQTCTEMLEAFGYRQDAVAHLPTEPTKTQARKGLGVGGWIVAVGLIITATMIGTWAYQQWKTDDTAIDTKPPLYQKPLAEKVTVETLDNENFSEITQVPNIFTAVIKEAVQGIRHITCFKTKIENPEIKIAGEVLLNGEFQFKKIIGGSHTHACADALLKVLKDISAETKKWTPARNQQGQLSRQEILITIPFEETLVP